MNDSPFICAFREEDKCSADQSDCPDKEYKGTCCLFCPKRWDCWQMCNKALSFSSSQKDNPSSRWSEKEKEDVNELERQAEVRIMGNPSKRKEIIKEEET